MGEFFTSDEQGIEGVCAVDTVFEEIFLRLGQLLAPFILKETVVSACHTGSLNSENQVIVVLAVEERQCLKPIKPFANHHNYESSEQEESQDEEEPEEPLGIMPKIAAIVFFVALLHLSSFFDKHSIDLSDMLLHLAQYPFVFLGE